MRRLLLALGRTALLVALVAAAGAAWASWRDRRGIDPPEPATWPPLDPPEPVADGEAAPVVDPEPAPVAARGPAQVADPEPAEVGEPVTWVAPGADGSCPLDHPVKVAAGSAVYHVPEGRFHERTAAVRCYPSAEAAEADGYRRSKR